MKKKEPKILFLIERFFIASIFMVLIVTLFVGIYFNKYDEEQKRRENTRRIHNVLSQLIIPSLVISDLSEVRRLLHMSSGVDETYLVIDNTGTIIMSDYGKRPFYIFSKKFKKTENCNSNITYEIIDGEKYSINCSILIDSNILAKTHNMGILFSFSKYDPFISFSSTVIYFVLILILLFLPLLFFLRRILYKQIFKPLVTLKNCILDISLDTSINPKITEIKKLPFELVEIKDAFERLLTNLQEEYKGRIEGEKMKALVDVTAGVCHDIRSPLSILELCITESKIYLPKEDVELQVEAIQSIRDIANNLLDKYRRPNSVILQPEEHDTLVKPLLISSIIDSIISQKKLEWKNSPCKITFNVEKNSKNKWVDSLDCEMRRVFSNILNNAYESLKNNGIIGITLKFINNKLLVIISDNGIGIPSSQIELVQNGFSSKHQGRGIGLSNAKQYMESLGGCLTINSQENIGTQVILNFPFYNNPSWLPEEIIINKNTTVVLLDDDHSTHEYWLQRLQKLDIPLIKFYSGNEFIEWYGQSNKSDTFIFFMDYELRGQSFNGLDLLKSINPRKKGFLITSHAEKNTFQKLAEVLDIWLLPKCLLSEIPLKIN